MEQRHKPSYFKYSDSKCTTTETPSLSNTSKRVVSKTDSVAIDSIESYVEEVPRNNVNVKKTGGFRGFFSLLPFRSGNKSKVQSSKKRRAQKDMRNDIPLSDDDVRNLISLYSKYENLYNPKNSQYGNKQIESIYYADMARSFTNKSGAQLQSYLHELRVSFEREHAIIENARRHTREILKPSIKYYTEFSFLLPFLNANGSQRSKEALDSSASTDCIGTKNFRTTAGKSPQSISQTPQIIGNVVCDNIAMSMPMQGNQFCGVLKKKKTRKEENEGSMREQQKIQQLTEQKDLKSGQEQEQQLEEGQEQSEQLDTEKSEEPGAKQLDGQVENSQAEPLEETPAEMSKCSCRSQLAKQQVRESNADQSASENLAALMNTGPSGGETSGKYKCQAVCSQFAIYKKVAANQVQQEPGRGEYAEDPRFASAANFQSRSNRGPQPPRPADYGRDQQSQSNSRRASVHRGPPPNSYGDNSQQVQLLCDMIRAELSSAPDFIYYDAKWRIIEILREVNKRQMIHKKGEPTQTAICPTAAPAMSPNTQRSAPARGCCKLKSNGCSYCPNGCRR